MISPSTNDFCKMVFEEEGNFAEGFRQQMKHPCHRVAQRGMKIVPAVPVVGRQRGFTSLISTNQSSLSTWFEAQREMEIEDFQVKGETKMGKLSWRVFRNSLITASLVLSAVVCFGIFLKTQNACAQEKAQPGILKELEEKIEKLFEGKKCDCKEKGKECDCKEKEKVKIPEIDPEVHRRILHFLNAARRPEDLMFPPPQEIQIEEEHMPMPEDHKEHEWLEKRTVEPILDIETAKRVFDFREIMMPLGGYGHIRELKEILRERFKDVVGRLSHHLGSAVYGEWNILYDTVHQGKTYDVEHAAMLHTGKVLLIGNTGTLLWDPQQSNPTMAFELPIGTPPILFCSGHSFLSDGKLLTVGGLATIKEAWKFDPDPVAKEWQKTTGDMAKARWYPTAVTLGDEPGRVLVANGFLGTTIEDTMEIYSENTDSFSTVTVTGPIRKLFPQTYPGLHLLPGGEIFYTPTGFRDCIGNNPAPYPAAGQSAYFKFSGPTTGQWTDIGTNDRTKGMAALLLQPTYPFVRIMVVGGGDLATSKTAQIINLSTLSPTWDPPIPFPDGLSRTNVNAVLLPDGTVFICGGLPASGTPPNGGTCWLYNPSSTPPLWSEMDELNKARQYHSVALLLPSGKIMATGGTGPGGCATSTENSIEVFSPPYLFKGARPSITSIITPDPVPDRVHHGQTFQIDTPQASDIGRVVLVRPSSITHHTNTDQRVIQLSFTQLDSDTLSVTMPDGGAAPYGVHTHAFAPRGYYMLFILKTNGVPSEAKFVHLH